MSLSITIDHVSKARELCTSILGKPFDPKGIGPDEFSCLGLLHYIYKTVFGVEIPVFSVTCRGSKSVADFADLFVQVPLKERRFADALYMLNPENLKDQHVAFVETKRWIVAASTKVGVHRQELSEILSVYPENQVYRLKCLQ